jgi:hypothetical protein
MSNRSIVRLAGLAITVAVICAAAIPHLQPANAQDNPDGLLFQVVAPKDAVAKGASDIRVEIRAVNADNLGAFAFQLEFDPDIVEVALDPQTQQPLIQRGDFLGSTGREVACPDPESQRGVLRMTCVTLRLEPDGPDGDGLLANVTFRAVGSGTSPLTLDRVQANNPDATEITPISIQSSAIEVEGGGGMNWLLWGGIIGAGALAAIGAAFVAMKARTRGGSPEVTAG